MSSNGDIVHPDTETSELDSIVTTAEDKVVERFDKAEEMASGFMDSAEGFLDSLINATDQTGFPMPILANQGVRGISYSFNPGDAPIEPSTEIYLPDFPVDPILQTIALIAGIQVRLQSDLANGVTGIDPNKENDIWMRDQERERLNVNEAKEKIAAEWSTRCFDLPDGVLVAQLTQAEIDYRNKFVDRSREIAVKQAELAFQNTQFIIKSILEMNQILITAVTEANKTTIAKYQADLEAYKTKVQAAIATVDEAIKGYEASGTIYRAKADAQAAIANVDVKAAEVVINQTISQMQLFLKQAEVIIERSRSMAQLRTAAAEAGGKIAAQLAAGAMAGVSVQAHISATGQVSKTYAGSESISESHFYEE
jgi:hypothetical protein